MRENAAVPPDPQEGLDRIARVLRIEAEALVQMSASLGPDHARALEILQAAQGRVVVSGIGKSGHVGRKIAATFASTGQPAQFVHPTEASHGDLGMITEKDVCLVISNSGETTELADLVTYSRRFAIPLIAVTGGADSTLARQADVTLLLPDAPEACPIGVAPTTSTTATLALGDALAVALMEKRGFRREDFEVFHPGGKLGAQLLSVARLMHAGADLPLVEPATPMSEGLVLMSAKGFGLAGLVEDGRLAGIVTDGDLRRNMHRLLDSTAGEVATRNPKTVSPDTLASEALKIMNEAKISALFVVDADHRVQGLLHIHDLLRAGVA
ncbi:KpsF/GutQ family sugar-phosphate isomerase [Allosediminivita pacifica]|uniref:Arabinose-5-phosphate isomerase n=1 Tax=Allosediminivita pacifica TaxID=1267769 RepID=A0A2T6A9C2_9RHOB|nr:KpsF/GutQ family sugar-phosphate isomerase [Allosediminivita pacifica]PTX40379.1 arabinose-5-phosphate isomerase [Allosediminivita pacifica]